jgi:hypothetical protein
MRCLQSLLGDPQIAANSLAHFRLHSDPFHFKFCKSTIADPRSSDMIPGTYVPLSYWEQFVNSPYARGPRNGIYVGEDNIGRNYSNTLFIDLVRNGWIGSSGVPTSTISTVVQELLATGDSVVLAAHYSVAT